jgi:hypothetical protein
VAHVAGSRTWISSAGEGEIDRQRRGEVGDDDPGGGGGQRPQVEELVGEEDRGKERQRNPCAAQRARPAARRRVQPPPEIAHQHDRTAGAEQIAGHEQGQHQQAAVLHPRHHGGEIGRRGLRPEQPVQHEDRGDRQEQRLEQRACMPPAQERADRRRAEQIERRYTAAATR